MENSSIPLPISVFKTLSSSMAKAVCSSKSGISPSFKVNSGGEAVSTAVPPGSERSIPSDMARSADNASSLSFSGVKSKPIGSLIASLPPFSPASSGISSEGSSKPPSSRPARSSDKDAPPARSASLKSAAAGISGNSAESIVSISGTPACAEFTPFVPLSFCAESPISSRSGISKLKSSAEALLSGNSSTLPTVSMFCAIFPLCGASGISGSSIPVLSIEKSGISVIPSFVFSTMGSISVRRSSGTANASVSISCAFSIFPPELCPGSSSRSMPERMSSKVSFALAAFFD